MTTTSGSPFHPPLSFQRLETLPITSSSSAYIGHGIGQSSSYEAFLSPTSIHDIFSSNTVWTWQNKKNDLQLGPSSGCGEESFIHDSDVTSCWGRGPSTSLAMGSQRPPSYQECPHCKKEFGSASLQIHLRRCSQDKGSSGKKKKKKDDGNNNSANNNGSNKGIRGESNSNKKKMARDYEAEISNDLKNSWPRRPNTAMSKKISSISRRRGDKSTSGRIQRPKTAVLKRPVILDEALKDKLDMTMTKKQFLAAVKLCKKENGSSRVPVMPVRRNRRAAVGYRRSNSIQSASSVGSARTIVIASSAAATRSNNSQIIKVGSPTKKTAASPKRIPPAQTTPASSKIVDLPKVELPNPALKLKNKAKAKKGKKGKGGVPEKVPEPCNSCGRNDYPERFHTHGANNNNHNHSSNKGGGDNNNGNGSKIPVKLHSPPKRMTTFEEKENKNKGDSNVVSNNKSETSPPAKSVYLSPTKKSNKAKAVGKPKSATSNPPPTPTPSRSSRASNRQPLQSSASEDKPSASGKLIEDRVRVLCIGGISEKATLKCTPGPFCMRN